MWGWLQQNSAIISALASIATLLVWAIYLQIIYQDYKRQRRPRLIVHQTQGSRKDARCLLINLSSEPIHIQCVSIAAEINGQEVSATITDYNRTSLQESTPKEIEDIVRQGPLQPGEFFQLGTFEVMLDLLAATAEHDTWLTEVTEQRLEVRVVAIYGNLARPVGARRAFTLKGLADRYSIQPVSLDTEQLYSRQAQRTAEGWLERCYEV